MKNISSTTSLKTDSIQFSTCSSEVSSSFISLDVCGTIYVTSTRTTLERCSHSSIWICFLSWTTLRKWWRAVTSSSLHFQPVGLGITIRLTTLRRSWESFWWSSVLPSFQILLELLLILRIVLKITRINRTWLIWITGWRFVSISPMASNFQKNSYEKLMSIFSTIGKRIE